MMNLTISALGQYGDGIADAGGERYFVPFTLPGDQIEAEADDGRMRLVSVTDPGPDRIEPFCPYFGTCGGCSLQHVGPTTYAAFKRDLVRTALDHHGLDEVEVDPLIDARGAGRRRATLHVRRDAAGYMRAKSHDVLDIEVCPILVPALREAAPRIAHALHTLVGDADAHFTATDTGLDLSVKSERKLKPTATAEFARAHKLARMTFNGEVVFMSRPPAVRMAASLVELPPNSFLQATAAAETRLGDLVLEGIGAAKSVADLFCGMGPFTLRMAAQAKVYAADSDRPAIEALKKAVNHTQRLKPVTAMVRDLFRDPLAPVELDPYDVIVFDPPRAGAEHQARELARSKVKRVVAVSCDPQSFARDAALLVAGGFKLRKVTPVDQFAWSPHVEVVATFKR